MKNKLFMDLKLDISVEEASRLSGISKSSMFSLLNDDNNCRKELLEEYGFCSAPMIQRWPKSLLLDETQFANYLTEVEIDWLSTRR